MQVLIVQLSTPWIIFQKYNCSLNEERGLWFLLTPIAQGFELSLGGGLRKNPQRLQQCLSSIGKLWKLLQYECPVSVYFFQWFEILYVLHFK